jgi:diguanylate cyclase (GGDEF)-like protein
MQRKLRESDTLARVGGDEFLLLLPEVNHVDDAKVVAAKLIDSLVEPFKIGEHSLLVTSSIGIAVFPRDGQNSIMLQRSADAAMYRAKIGGRNGYSI